MLGFGLGHSFVHFYHLCIMPVFLFPGDDVSTIIYYHIHGKQLLSPGLTCCWVKLVVWAMTRV